MHLQIASEAINREKKLSDKAVATDYIIANLLKEMAETVKGLTEEIAIEKYKVALIGTIGSGKTTTICHLLDLYFENDSEKVINKRIRRVKEMPLLSVVFHKKIVRRSLTTTSSWQQIFRFANVK